MASCASRSKEIAGKPEAREALILSCFQAMRRAGDLLGGTASGSAHDVLPAVRADRARRIIQRKNND